MSEALTIKKPQIRLPKSSLLLKSSSYLAKYTKPEALEIIKTKIEKLIRLHTNINELKELITNLYKNVVNDHFNIKTINREEKSKLITCINSMLKLIQLFKIYTKYNTKITLLFDCFFPDIENPLSYDLLVIISPDLDCKDIAFQQKYLFYSISEQINFIEADMCIFFPEIRIIEAQMLELGLLQIKHKP